MNTLHRTLLPLAAAALGLLAPPRAAAQDAPATQDPPPPPLAVDFATAAADVAGELAAASAELTALIEAIGAEQVPLHRRLREAEEQLLATRKEYQDKARDVDQRKLDVATLRSGNEQRRQEAGYLNGLFSDYATNFESRLHVAELQRWEAPIAAARQARESRDLQRHEVDAAQVALLSAAIDRLDDALGGMRFEGRALDPAGGVREGSFVVIGPVAVFRSRDGAVVGPVEQRIGSAEPTVVPFLAPADVTAATQVATAGTGVLPVDLTLGDAQKIADLDEPLLEHIKKGGVVMFPIFGLAGAALLVVLYKWLSMAFIPTPSRRQLDAVLEAVARRDAAGARREADELGGPIGRMLDAGIEHLEQPKELIEEVMYEQILATRLRLQRMLPFVAISASSAPLLGLLGTVTGIMETFKRITVFGTGDPKTLSSGISVALITTEYGLIVAIPSLLLHAFLSRKARRVVDEMEKAAIAFVNQLAKAPAAPPPAPAGQAA